MRCRPCHIAECRMLMSPQPMPRLVYASSSSVYGLNQKQPFSEADRVDNPASLYASTKRVRLLPLCQILCLVHPAATHVLQHVSLDLNHSGRLSHYKSHHIWHAAAGCWQWCSGASPKEWRLTARDSCAWTSTVGRTSDIRDMLGQIQLETRYCVRRGIVCCCRQTS